MLSERKFKNRFHEYHVSARSLSIAMLVTGFLTWLLNNYFPSINNILNNILLKILPNKSLTYIEFFCMILELVIIITGYISFLRFLCYIPLFFCYKFDYKKPKVYKIYERNTLSYDTIMYTFTWITYCLALHDFLTTIMKTGTLSAALTSFIVTFTGAVVLWCFYIKTCVKAMKEDTSFDYNSNFLFIFAKILRPILVATVAWVAIVINFILNYDISDKFEGIRIISSILNNLVTLSYPIIDIFTYVYSELYKN